MARHDEPKLDELKKLLRRLDGLDGDKSLGKTPQETEQRGYVGALRGAPAPDPEEARKPAPASAKTSTNIYVAAVLAAAVSALTVFLVMSWQGRLGGMGHLKTSPGTFELNQPAAGARSTDPQQTDTASGLVRRADTLLASGEIEAARALLQRAAELGSGSAALKLGFSYDPSQKTPLSFADSRTNPALAKAWYERALALGTQEAASYLSNPSGK